MSTRRGGETSRTPAHQNKFAFRHNKNSKKTAKIAAMPIYCNIPLLSSFSVVCERCRKKIEWKKKYRKYKPLTAPGKCVKCGNRNVKAAYHQVCDDCARVLFGWGCDCSLITSVQCAYSRGASLIPNRKSLQTPVPAAALQKMSSRIFEYPLNRIWTVDLGFVKSCRFRISTYLLCGYCFLYSFVC